MTDGMEPDDELQIIDQPECDGVRHENGADDPGVKGKGGARRKLENSYKGDASLLKERWRR